MQISFFQLFHFFTSRERSHIPPSPKENSTDTLYVFAPEVSFSIFSGDDLRLQPPFLQSDARNLLNLQGWLEVFHRVQMQFSARLPPSLSLMGVLFEGEGDERNSNCFQEKVPPRPLLGNNWKFSFILLLCGNSNWFILKCYQSEDLEQECDDIEDTNTPPSKQNKSRKKYPSPKRNSTPYENDTCWIHVVRAE